MTEPQGTPQGWTDEARAAVDALESKYDIELVSGEHHAKRIEELERTVAGLREEFGNTRDAAADEIATLQEELRCWKSGCEAGYNRWKETAAAKETAERQLAEAQRERDDFKGGVDAYQQLYNSTYMELAALREQLALEKRNHAITEMDVQGVMQERDELKEQLAEREARIAELDKAVISTSVISRENLKHASRPGYAWVPVELVQRCIAALHRHLDRHGLMRVPVDQTDSDIVKAELEKVLEASKEGGE